MAIYGNTISFSGGGQNDTLPPLLDNFRASKGKNKGIHHSSIPGGSTFILGKYKGKPIRWIKLPITQSKAGVPENRSTLKIYDKFLIPARELDGKEESSSYAPSPQSGLVMEYTSLYQWLNSDKSGGTWWSYDGNQEWALHYNPASYANENGFLYEWTEEEKNALVWNYDNPDKRKRVYLGKKEEISSFGGIYPIYEESSAINRNSNSVFELFDVFWTGSATDTFDDFKNAFVYGYRTDYPSNNEPRNLVEKMTKETKLHIEPIFELDENIDLRFVFNGTDYVLESAAETQPIVISADKMQESRATDLAGAVWVYGDHLPNNVNDGTKIELDRNDVVSSELGLSLTLGELPPSDANYKVVVNIPESDGNLHRYIYLANKYHANGAYQDAGILLREEIVKTCQATQSNTAIFNDSLLKNECSNFAESTLSNSIKPYNIKVNVEQKHYMNNQIQTYSYKCFALSTEEAGFSSSIREGKAFPYLNTNQKRVAQLNGNNNAWWLRTIETGLGRSSYVLATGGNGVSSYTDWSGFRPAVAMSLDLPLNPIPKEDGSYDFLETTKSKAKTVKETKQTVGNLPSKSKVKLGRYGGNELTWLTTKDAEGRQYLRLDSGSVSLTPFKAMMYDNKEPNNTDTNIRNNGNNMFTLSNLFQWLNSDKSANNWYTPQHAYDAPPPYANQDGFLKDWTEQEKQILLNKVWETSVPKTVSSSLQKFTAKVVVPSMTEVGISSNMGGSKLDIYTNNSDRVVNGSPYWTRSSDPNNTYMARGVDYQGGGASSNCIRADMQVVPLVSIPINTPVELGSDGAYRLLLDVMLPTVKVTVTYPKNKNFYARQFTYNPKKQYQTMLEGAIAYIMQPTMKVGDLPSKSTVKLGRYGENELTWWTTKGTENNSDSQCLIFTPQSAKTAPFNSMMYDAPEPKNPEPLRDRGGNNNYGLSNVHQWLNSDKSANTWYSATHEYDTPPDYANKNGFLYDWTDQEKSILLNSTWYGTESTADSGTEVTYRAKVVLPSTRNFGGSSSELDYKLEIFSSNSSDKIISGGTQWTRTPFHNNGYSVMSIDEQGNFINTTVCKDPYIVRPLVNISPDTLVYAEPDENGVYSFCFEKEVSQ